MDGFRLNVDTQSVVESLAHEPRCSRSAEYALNRCRQKTFKTECALIDIAVAIDAIHTSKQDRVRISGIG